ncbi:MAG TPA: alanine:cation symporter family protein, partial [Dietzia timorensis]
VTIFFLAFSSILGSAYIGEVNVRFIRESDTWVNVFRAIVCVMVVIGTVSSLELVWNLADLFMGVMATINLIALIPLAKIGLKLMTNYGEQRKQGLEPVFSRDDIPEAKNVSSWDGTDPITVRTPGTDVNA